MVSHTLIMECVDKVGVANAVKRLLVGSMKTWQTTLKANTGSLEKLFIRRGIFQDKAYVWEVYRFLKEIIVIRALFYRKKLATLNWV